MSIPLDEFFTKRAEHVLTQCTVGSSSPGKRNWICILLRFVRNFLSPHNWISLKNGATRRFMTSCCEAWEVMRCWDNETSGMLTVD